MKKRWLVGMCLVMLMVSCASNQQAHRQQEEAARKLAGAYMKQGNYTMALRELLKAQQYYAHDPDLQNDLGFVYMQKNRMDLAIAHFKNALDLKSDFPSAKNNLGAAYLSTRQLDEAIACFKDLTENLVYATPQKPLVNLGVAYYYKKEYQLSERYFNEALVLYREGLRKDPDYIRTLYGLGQTHMATGRVQQAIDVLKQALQDAPRTYPVYFKLAEAYELTADYDQAHRAYQKVVDIAPQSDLARQARAADEKLKPFLK